MYEPVFPSFEWKSSEELSELRNLLLNDVSAVEVYQHKKSPIRDLIKVLNRGSNKLLALRISDYEIDKEVASSLSKLLLDKFSLQYFGLRSTKLSISVMENFANVLRLNRSLLSLSLSECELKDAHISLIANELEYYNRSLIQLDLSNNKIGDSGAILLAKVFKSNYILTSVFLQNNVIAQKGGNAISDALENTNFALTTLELSGNNIGDIEANIRRLLGGNRADQRNAFYQACELAKEAPLMTTKVNIVGQDKSGKTVLLRKLFDENVDDHYAPSFAISKIPVQARIDGSPWRKYGLQPLKGYYPEFLARFANICLERKLSEDDRKVIEKKKQDMRESRTRSRGFSFQSFASVSSRTGRSRGLSIQSFVAGPSSSPNMATLRRNSANRRGSADPHRRRASSALGLLTVFKRKKNDKLDESKYLFLDEDNEISTRPNRNFESKMEDFFEPEVMAKARRERDNIRFNIFEFSGKLMYYSLFQSLITESGVYLVTFNLAHLSGQSSSESLNVERYLNYWLKTIRYQSPGASIVLVGTHVDQISPKQLKKCLKVANDILNERLIGVFRELIENKKVRAAFEAEKFKASLTGAILPEISLLKNNKNELNFFPVSQDGEIHINTSFLTRIHSNQCINITGEGIKNLREALDKLAEKQKYFNESIPPRYFKFLDMMLQTNKPWIDYATVKKCADKALGELAHVEMSRALKIFKANGTILQIKGSMKGKYSNAVILDPMWLAENVSKVIMNNGGVKYNYDKLKLPKLSTAKYQGILKQFKTTATINRDVLKTIWATEHITFLTKFLEESLLISRWGFGGDDTKYIVPGSLPYYNGRPYEPSVDARYADFDFHKTLTIGVYERLVCLILQSMFKSASSSQVPELYYGFSRFYWGDDFHFVLLRCPDSIKIYIEKSKLPPFKCVKRLQKMMGKVQDILGEGLEYTTKTKFPKSDKFTTFQSVLDSRSAFWHLPF